MDTRKEAICDALLAWINQRPGLEFANYGDVSSYRAEQRSIARDKQEALTLLAAVRWRDSITADDLIEASRHSFSGRLSIKFREVANKSGPAGGAIVDYCTGQYWPTEYRRAVCAVLAGALWNWQRDKAMPAPMSDDGQGTRLYAGFKAGHKSPDAMSAGDYLRNTFKREFGKSLASRWFN